MNQLTENRCRDAIQSSDRPGGGRRSGAAQHLWEQPQGESRAVADGGRFTRLLPGSACCEDLGVVYNGFCCNEAAVYMVVVRYFAYLG